MKKRRGEVPAWIRLPRVPVYNQPGRSVAIELKDRICPICHRNDLESANRKGELVAVEGKPAHLACAEKKDPAKKAEPPRQGKPAPKAAEAAAKKAEPFYRIRPEMEAEIGSFFVLPLNIWETATPETTRRLGSCLRLANLAVPKPGAAVAMEAMASAQ